jgi:hypothetical protein
MEHHTPSPSAQALFEAVVAGATHPDIEGVEVVRRAALAATVTDVLEADGYLLGTPCTELGGTLAATLMS